jgi:hypothetical protein
MNNTTTSHKTFKGLKDRKTWIIKGRYFAAVKLVQKAKRVVRDLSENYLLRCAYVTRCLSEIYSVNPGPLGYAFINQLNPVFSARRRLAFWFGRHFVYWHRVLFSGWPKGLF